MIEIDKDIILFDEKIKFQAIRSSGPGGQHVNKVSTAIILKYDLKIHSKWGGFFEARNDKK